MSTPIAVERRPRVRYLILDVPVTQTGIVEVTQVKLPDNAVRVVGLCLTNAVTDQPLRTNLRYSGTGAAALAVTEANIELLAKAVLDASFTYFEVPAPTGAKKIYFAYPTRLGTPAFYAGPEATAAAVAFTKRGATNVTDNELSVNESFTLYESNDTITAATRIYVRGLNLSGRPIPAQQLLAAPTDAPED